MKEDEVHFARIMKDEAGILAEKARARVSFHYPDGPRYAEHSLTVDAVIQLGVGEKEGCAVRIILYVDPADLREIADTPSREDE
jgi:hypothetical protein